jgi:hypothetical protein
MDAAPPVTPAIRKNFNSQLLQDSLELLDVFLSIRDPAQRRSIIDATRSPPDENGTGPSIATSCVSDP